MPSLKYYLPKGAGPKLIELSIAGDDLVVFLDGREVGTTPRKNHVKEFLLEDGNRIDVGPFGLEVRWNGRLVDSTGEPVLAWKVGRYLLLTFAFFGFWTAYNNLENELEWATLLGAPVPCSRGAGMAGLSDGIAHRTMVLCDQSWGVAVRILGGRRDLVALGA